MKLKSLHIQNFRALEDFKVKKLGNVNLIVGKNNSGKSSVLEALRIYAGNANRVLLAEIAGSHDEKYTFSEKERGSDDTIFPFESFFTGRVFSSGKERRIAIGEVGNVSETIYLRHVQLIESEETVTSESGESRTRGILKPIPQDTLFEFLDNQPVRQAIQVIKDKKIWLINLDTLDEPRRMRMRMSSMESQDAFSCSYIPTQFVSSNELAREWDKISLTGKEEWVTNALKFIESDYENIAFVEDDRIESRFPQRSAKVKVKGLSKPIPLNSMGDGMFRLLQLALKAIAAKDGFLLIDEFENGLHYSVQEKVWSWLFELAKEFNIQIFATTHSWDCVESFSKVANDKKDVEGVLFRVGRGVKAEDIGKIVATEFDEEELAIITQSAVEVR